MIDPRSVPVRFSRLKNIARSPAHYLYSLTDDADTKARRLGRATHHLIAGTGGYIVYDGGNRTGKKWAEFKSANPGKDIYTAPEFATAHAMSMAVAASAEARRIIDAAHIKEKTHHWTDMGRECQGTPDGWGRGGLYDVKTARCAQPDRFIREAIAMHYPSQLAWYRDVIDRVYTSPTRESRDTYIIAVESAPPYPVTVLKLTDRALEQGRKLCRLWMERLLACEAADEWPAYVQSVVDFDLPEPDEGLDLVFGDEDEGEEAA